MPPNTCFKIRRKDSDKVLDDKLVEKEELKIGSQPEPENDLVLNHPAVSPVHAIICEKDGRLWIVDILDSNATLLNGLSINEARLLDRDEIQIGPYSLRFYHDYHEPDTVLIVVERKLKAAIRPLAGAASRPDESSRYSGIVPEEQEALRIFWQSRKGPAGKVAVSTSLYPLGIFRSGKARFNWSPTGDLEPVKRRLWLTLAGSAVLFASIFALVFWRDAYSPAPVASAHSSSEMSGRGIALRTVSSCSDCHQMFSNLQANCALCHGVPSGPGVRGFDPSISDKHREAKIGCAGCHSEHSGADFQIKDVDNRSCMSCHNDQYTFRGRVVGAPHKGSLAKPDNDSPGKPGLGYIRADGAVTWKDKTGQEALVLFHGTHPYAREKCSYCHQGIFGTDEWEKSPRAACQACHAVSFTTEGRRPIGPNCATCHKQHGHGKDLGLVLSRIPDSEIRQFTAQVRSKGLYSLGDTTERFTAAEIGGTSVRRQGGVDWNWRFVSSLGVAPWYIWLASLGTLALVGIGLIAVGNWKWKKVPSPEADQEAETEYRPMMQQPIYTFPRIDPDLCIGCYACIEACPHDVLAMSIREVDRKFEEVAAPVAIAQCMDDAGCLAACPTKAVTVVNSRKEPPKKERPSRNQETYLTNVPGIYVVGEVSRVPLIKYAITEGDKVIEDICKDLRDKVVPETQYHVAIIGAGPAGLSAALKAKREGLRYIAIEQDEVCATIKHYPVGKSINLKADAGETNELLTVPVDSENSRKKEAVVKYWTEVITSNNLTIHENEACTEIKQGDDFFTITTAKGETGEKETYTARRIVLALGCNSNRKKLDAVSRGLKVPLTECNKCGASLSPAQEICLGCNARIDSSTESYLDGKIRYRLTDPRHYVGKKCVVVGGGNSAIEAAIALTGFGKDEDQFTSACKNEVTLLVRSVFTHDLKLENKMNLYDCWDTGKIDVRLGTEIKDIREHEVILMNDKKEETGRIPYDYIFVLIGGQWPRGFLKKLGIGICED